MDFSDPKVKYAGLGVVAALALALGYVGGCIGGQPIPGPSSSPSPVASVPPSPTASPAPSPTPSASPSPSPSSGLKLFAMTNETTSFTASPQAAEELPVLDGMKLEAFEIMPYTSTIPSAKGYPTGDIPTALFPVARLRAGVTYWVDLTPLKAGVFTGYVAGTAFQLTGLSAVMKREPSIPIYSELQYAQIWKAHAIPDTGGALAAKCSLTLKYKELLRAHRVEPIKAWHTVYPAVVNGHVDQTGYFPQYGCDFATQVLKGRIAPPNLYGPDPVTAPPAGLLAAAQADLASGLLPAGTFSYDWDEGEGDATLSAAALARGKTRRQTAPLLQGMITRRPSPDFALYFDQFYPVENYYVPGMNAFGWYASCMGNGNCGNVSDPALVNPPTKYPVAVLDAPRVMGLVFPLSVYSVGGKAALYFNTTQRLTSAWVKDGVYNEGGQGDGTKLFPGVTGMKGLTDHVPVATIELKYWRKGSYLIEYLKAAKAAGLAVPNPVKSPTEYSLNEGDYESVRELIARALYGLK